MLLHRLQVHCLWMLQNIPECASHHISVPVLVGMDTYAAFHCRYYHSTHATVSTLIHVPCFTESLLQRTLTSRA